MTGNERWRIVTPILLSFLTLMSSFAIWILNDLKDKVGHTCELIENHVSDPNLHYSVVKDMEWIKKFVIKNGGLK